MARADTLSKLYAPVGTALEFNYATLTAPPLRALIPQQDIDYLYRILTSIKYNSKIDFKEKEVKRIMEMRGFKRFHAGTHRVAYRSLDFPNLIVKISMNKSSLTDNLREYENQFFLQPFCTKVFEVDPTGVIGLFERVEPLQSREEYASVAGDVFDFLNEKIIGKYIVDDIGTNYFMNIGLRSVKSCGYAFGPVLLDFPEVYPLDGDKLYCNANKDGIFCGGVIDYDAGFNTIRCTKCGRPYEARELMKLSDRGEVIKKGESTNMKMLIKRGDKVIEEIDTSKETSVIEKPKSNEHRYNRMSLINNPIGRGTCKPKKDYAPEMRRGNKQENEDIKYYGTSSETVGEKLAEKIPEVKEEKVEYDVDTGFIPKIAEKNENLVAGPKEHDLERTPDDEEVVINVDALKSSMNGMSTEDASDEYLASMEENHTEYAEPEDDDEDNSTVEDAEDQDDIEIDPASIAANVNPFVSK